MFNENFIVFCISGPTRLFITNAKEKNNGISKMMTIQRKIFLFFFHEIRFKTWNESWSPLRKFSQMSCDQKINNSGEFSPNYRRFSQTLEVLFALKTHTVHSVDQITLIKLPLQKHTKLQPHYSYRKLGGALRGWSTHIWTKMCNEVIFPRTFKTSYFLYSKSISGIFKVLTTLESTILEKSLFVGNLILSFGA